MTHEELREQLLDLACGELAPRAARQVEEHAASCEACRSELAGMRATRRLMSALPEEPAPSGGERILLAAAREAASRREPRRMFAPWLWRASVAAIALAAVAGVSYRVMSLRPDAPGREDPDALLGEPRYARAPQPAPAAEPEPPHAAAAPEPAVEPPRAPPVPQIADAAPLASKPAPVERRPARAPSAGSGRADDREKAYARERREDLALAAPEPAPPPSDGAGDAPANEAAAAARAPEPSAELPGAAGAVAGAVPDRFAAPPRAMAPAPAPARRAAKAAPPAASEREASPRAEASTVSRYEELRRSGRLRVETRTFPGCDAELLRRVERDPSGAIVGYAWEARVGDRRLRYEVVYEPDGAVALARVVDAATGEVERALFRPPARGDLDLNAPPRCR